VLYSVPYWYSGDKANEVFNNIDAYAKVIRQEAGYFVYGQQIDEVFDPLPENIFQPGLYQNMTG
jgi:hypothetical protein